MPLVSRDILCSLIGLFAGSYTFAKTLEYKAKQGLNSGKEVTVVPPNEYQERFVSAMDDYFLACPGALYLIDLPCCVDLTQACLRDVAP